MRVGKLKESGGRMTIDVIERAIESAKCRIYRVRANVGQSLAHQVKADNQAEIQQVTIEALEKQVPKKPNKHKEDILGEYYSCPSCMNNELDDIFDNYCPRCGQKLDWGEEE